MWDLYEEGDSRREGSINKWEPGQYTARFQDTGLFMAKYAARVGYNPQGDVDLNYCNNLRIFRYSEALLTYAEMIAIHGQSELQDLCPVRSRPGASAPSVLKAHPGTFANIKLERRREL